MIPNRDQATITQLQIDVGIIKDQQTSGKEQMDRIEKKIDGMKYATTEDLASVIKMLDDYKKETKETYVPITRYSPVEKVVFGLIALILLGVGGAVVAGVLK